MAELQNLLYIIIIIGFGFECLLSIVYSFSYQVKRISFLSSGANLGSSTLLNGSSSIHGQYDVKYPLSYGGLVYCDPIFNVSNSIVIAMIRPDATIQNVTNVSDDCFSIDSIKIGVYSNNSVKIPSLHSNF